MNHTIIVKGFRNKGARMIVARRLMREAGITLDEALAQTEHLPITLVRFTGREAIGSTIDRFSRLGIDAQAIEALPRTSAVHENNKNIGIPPAQSLTTPPKQRSPISLRNGMVLGGSVVFAAALLYGLYLPFHPSAPDARALMKKNKAGLLDATGRGVTPAARERAKQLVDSAQAFGNDAEIAIRFYTIAIAFNKYNLNAWFGLLDAYKRSGRTRDMEVTRQAMRDLFGERGFSIESVIRPFGALSEMRNENGTLTIEYRTNNPLVRKKLIHETFLIYRAIRNDCGCSALSIFAFRNGSNGLVVHLSASKEIVSASEFEQKATIRFFDAQAGKKNGVTAR